MRGKIMSEKELEERRKQYMLYLVSPAGRIEEFLNQLDEERWQIEQKQPSLSHDTDSSS
jgi:hypothetical protein